MGTVTSLDVTVPTDTEGVIFAWKEVLMKRRPMSKKLSKKVFRRGSKVHSKNLLGSPMRGGIRL